MSRYVFLRLVVLSAIVITAFGCLVCAAEDIVLGELDGTHKLTVKDITDGFDGGQANYIKSCAQHDALGDKFILTVEMGSFRDHLVPKKDVTVCGLLTSLPRERRYLYAVGDPRKSSWDGRSAEITPSLYENALGGSAEGYTSGGRSTLSFWGDNSSNVNHVGGCCTLLPGQSPAWRRPYRLLVFPKEHAMYLAWGTEPTLVLSNGPVPFEVNVWNMRSEPYDEQVTFDITINGDKTTVESPNGRHVHYASAPGAGAALYNITVDLVSGPDVLNAKQLKVEVDVLGEFPPDVAPLTEAAIPQLLHFGDMGVAIGPVDKREALDEDWFALTVVGGEAAIHAVSGSYNMAKISSALSMKEMWKNVSTADGVFRANVPCKSMQYYAFALCSAVDQHIVMEYEYNTAAVVYVSGKRFVLHGLSGTQKQYLSVRVTEGYHQVLVKLFSDDGSAGVNGADCTVESVFSVRVVGPATGYTQAIMPGVVDGRFEMWNNYYMFYLLHLGEKTDDYLYGRLDEDFINVATAIPKPGDSVEGKLWTPLVFRGGNIPVSAENLPKDKEAAVSYVAFALYNSYQTDISLSWIITTGGKCDFFIDGSVRYNTSNDSRTVTKNITTPISPGWHNVIVRFAAVQNQMWNLMFYIRFDNHRLWGASFLGTSLPLGMVSVRQNTPLVSMMELLDSESRSGAIPFDPSNKTVTQDTFTDLPTDAYYWPALLSKQSISVLGKERQFAWNGVRSADGVWGQRAFGGDFYQYWATAFYATATMKATLHIVTRGSYAVWLNGKVIGSAPLSDQRDNYHVMALNKEWNQMIVKLRGNNSFQMIDTKNHRLTWTKANAVCGARGNMSLCPLSAVCPYGVGRPGVIPVTEDSSFVPVSDRPNEWVQVSANGGSDAALCQTWQSTHSGSDPPWSETDENVLERHLVPCCDSGLPPSLWLSVDPSPDAGGELGYTYEVSLIIERPVVRVNSTVSLTREVTITSATPNAAIMYATDDAKDMVKYTGPFKVDKATTVIAQAFAQGRESQVTQFFINIPSIPFIDRSLCISNVICRLLVSGVDPGKRISVLKANAPKELTELCLNVTHAVQQQPSPNFSGVLYVDASNSVIVPPLGAGIFRVILYNDDGKGSSLSNHLSYEDTELCTTYVIGTQRTLLHVRGGVMSNDLVLIPFGPTGSPTKCGAETCGVELKQNVDRASGSFISGNSFFFYEDMRGFEGNLNCLCLCLSCAQNNPDKGGHLIDQSKVVSLAINLHVSRPPAPRGIVVDYVEPYSVGDGDILVFHGTFDINSACSVRFVTTDPENDKRVAPQCISKDVTDRFFRCRMVVRAASMGLWNVTLMDGEQSIPFATESDRQHFVRSPNPSLKFVSGACPESSSNCVNGARLTFHGANFSPILPAYNDVVVGDGNSEYPIQCPVYTANETEFSCVLNIPRDKMRDVFPLAVRTRISPYEWSEGQNAGYLILGASTNVPGWMPNYISRFQYILKSASKPALPSQSQLRLPSPPPVPVPYLYSRADIIILSFAVAFGGLSCVLLLGLAVFICLRLTTRKYKEEEPLELQLLYDDGETVLSKQTKFGAKQYN